MKCRQWQPGYVLSMGAESFLQLESPNEESNQRSLVPFVAETLSGRTPTEKKCGLECKRRGWCKSYNHNMHLATCELIMTDYRLLEKPRGEKISKKSTKKL